MIAMKNKVVFISVIVHLILALIFLAVALASPYVKVTLPHVGDCYHRSSCQTLSRKGEQVTISEAKALGYRSCGVCDPPSVIVIPAWKAQLEQDLDSPGEYIYFIGQIAFLSLFAVMSTAALSFLMSLISKTMSQMITHLVTGYIVYFAFGLLIFLL